MSIPVIHGGRENNVPYSGDETGHYVGGRPTGNGRYGYEEGKYSDRGQAGENKILFFFLGCSSFSYIENVEYQSTRPIYIDYFNLKTYSCEEYGESLRMVRKSLMFLLALINRTKDARLSVL